jgi:hypothetical protein
MLTRQEIKDKLPKGAVARIAIKADVKKFAVYAYLNGSPNGHHDDDIEIAALEILAEQKEKQEKKRELMAKIS